MQSEKTIERRQSSFRLIEHMLDGRKQLLALLFQVSSMEILDKEFLEEFCQSLVDYIASGHFGLYERIIEKKERRKAVVELAEKIYPDIEKTTQIALVFSETYGDDMDDIDSIKNKFSNLGEALTMRIELEDQLIAKLTNGPDHTK